MESMREPASNGRRFSRATTVDHRLRAAIAYMRAHVSEPMTVEDVAGRVGLSRAHFFTMFRDQLNTTPQVFWSAVRVEEVVRRLMFRTEPLTSVALELGFSSPGNFSRFFKEHMGVHLSKGSGNAEHQPDYGDSERKGRISLGHSQLNSALDSGDGPAGNPFIQKAKKPSKEGFFITTNQFLV
jgi:AraC-like DNA-binding protein